MILMRKIDSWGFDQSNINWQMGIWSKHNKWFSCEKLTAGDLIKAKQVILMWIFDSWGFDQIIPSDSHVKNGQLWIWSKHDKWYSCEKLIVRDLIKAWCVILMCKIDSWGIWSKHNKWFSCEKLTAGDMIKVI